MRNTGRLICRKVKYLACLQLVIISPSFPDSLITAMLLCSQNQVVSFYGLLCTGFITSTLKNIKGQAMKHLLHFSTYHSLVQGGHGVTKALPNSLTDFYLQTENEFNNTIDVEKVGGSRSKTMGEKREKTEVCIPVTAA